MAAALRERLTVRNLLGWLVVVAILALLAGQSHAQFAATLAMTAVVGVGSLLSDAYDLRESVEAGWTGATAMLGGGALLALDGEAAWLGAVFLVVGGWFVLDAVQTARHEGPSEPNVARDGHDVYRDYVTRRVHETLEDRPRTRRELDEALDADAEDVDGALERLVDRGAVERAGSEFRVGAESEPGPLARARDYAAAFVGRVVRPVTIEFDRDRADEDWQFGADRPPGTDSSGTGSAGEREREPERESATDG